MKRLAFSQTIGPSQRSAKPFIALKTAEGIIKFIAVREILKIVANRERLELTVLLTSGDKDVVKFRSWEDLEDAIARIYSAYASVFLAP